MATCVVYHGSHSNCAKFAQLESIDTVKNSTAFLILVVIVVILLASGGKGASTIAPETSIEHEISTTFGVYATQAINIARCESSLNPAAYNPTPVWDGEHAMGLFQIIPSTFHRVSNGNPYNATDNIDAAYKIFSGDGYSWREWECKPY